MKLEPYCTTNVIYVWLSPFYVSLSVFEVTLRNALSRELEMMTGRQDWYAVFPNTPGLTNLNRYITQANKQIAGRHESATPSK